MSKIVSNTIVGDNPGQYYGTLLTSGIQYDDGTPVAVQKALYVKFLAPTKDVTLSTIEPWVNYKFFPEPEPVGDGSFKITGGIQLDGPYTFPSSGKLTWGINGDLRGDASRYTSSFEFYVDELPSGIVAIKVPSVPDSRLSGSEQTISLTKGETTLSYLATPGQTTTFSVPGGQYVVKAGELANNDETVVATASVSPTDINIEVGETTTLTVTYDTVQEYSALDVTVGQLSPPLDKEYLTVQVEIAGGEPIVFTSANNHTTSLRRLPASGDATVGSGITVNNTKYSSSQSVPLSNALTNVTIGSDDIKSTPVDTSEFVTLPINITIDDPSVTGQSSALRLVSTDPATVVYDKKVAVASGTTTLGVPVAPGEYAVQATGFIVNGTLYGADVVNTIVVAADGSSELDLGITLGPHLLVRGFPDYLSFGALTDLVDTTGKDLTAARVSSIFKYAGTDGAGDPGAYLDDDSATRGTVALAALISQNLGRPVLPVMISYTVNLSGGDPAVLQNAEGLEHSFGNLILSLQIVGTASANDVPAGFIVNPDFLGANQQGGRGAEFSMPVVGPLTEALKHRGINEPVPSPITDTLAGYTQAVNWLIRTVAPNVTFGWQVNLWGVGRSEWIYGDDAAAPITNGKATANYAKSLSAYGGEYEPDFLAIDRYEADDFTYRSYGNAYCYGPREWRRYYEFVQAIALELKTPVMPWQIPASRIPSVDEPNVSAGSLEHDHWGTGGTYIFGDPAIGSDLGNIHPAILAIRPVGLPYDTVEELFRASEPFDLSGPTYNGFPLGGIFAVLLGGGSTTGVVSSIGTTGAWTQEQISKYMEHPLPLNPPPQNKNKSSKYARRA